MYKIKFKSRIVDGRRKTTAMIFDDSGAVQGGGTVHQFIGDRDVKVIGQKYALDRALMVHFKKNERIEIWKQFSNRSKAAKKLMR